MFENLSKPAASTLERDDILPGRWKPRVEIKDGPQDFPIRAEFRSPTESKCKKLELECECYSRCPRENGTWTGERGDSEWKPDPDYVPPKQNPEGQTWSEILKEYGIDSIPFENGEPKLNDISKGDVEIDDFSSDRSKNFAKADIALAKERGCTPEEVAQWRKENGYTWHECSDMRTMQKVPSKVHNNIPHAGGVSRAKMEGR